MTSRVLVTLGVALPLLHVASATAQTPDAGPWEKASISLGGFISTTNSEFQLNSKTLGVGTVVDLENGLNMNAD